MANLSTNSQSKEDLFRLAREEIPTLNSGQKVIAVLRKHGIEGKYDPEKWEEYTHVLEVEKLSLLDEANSKDRDRLVASIQSSLAKTRNIDGTVGATPVKKCVECGADAISAPEFNNKFGMIYGWRCSKVPGHSALAGWRTLLKYYVDKYEERLAIIEEHAKEQVNGQN